MTAALPAFDLNLLPILLALHDARSVSMAAQQLGMSQPGVSTALAKLRTAFGDPLFVRTSRGMEPTPRALALIPAARDVLARIQQGIVETGAFDPATTTHLFSIALSDVGEMVFLPRIVEAMARQAPHASVQSVTLPPAQIERALETGTLDLAVGYFPDLKKNNFFQQRLFTHYFTCIVRADHPVTRGGNTRLSMQQFLEYGHAVVRAEGRSQELYERFLERKRIRRKPALLTPHFMSIPFILARTDLIATVPHAVGLSFMQSHANIRVMEPPLALPSFDLKQHWHRKFHNDARSQWLRALVSSLFNDEADEWREPGHQPARRRQTQ
ncbi:LysR family transcriptional regulator [Ralstonia nicotianae]|uniref:LysR family transcriptional regulator n=1 Tax=Ralstonia solanacearum species complex TaxID=3116862 RepID=UPI00030BBD31|nr:LysR family transcriptional regulator [Ralstonia pseudosolanacearum]AXV73340.1 LysR family transcriptional regulator [Ralstonia solanacearum]AXW14556.1 LysR family transcriptional regulator [Ralstonia solanacearum]AXW37890.1 LysR family transcriptional regulator [Ralstonia solanacearum]AXW70734.1 LysR family transcriptional regulator [Ralstonia solanacearum]MCK4124722.1 LysR family transcriptional regulator [Ralstonia pseudosolanacearum]